MGLFRRRPRSPISTDLLPLLESFGRFSLDPYHSGLDAGALWEKLGALYEFASTERDTFLGELRAVAVRDHGGFATLGVARLVWEFYGEESPGHPAAAELIDAGIHFVLSRGLPTMMLTGLEMRRLVQLREQNREPQPLC